MIQPISPIIVSTKLSSHDQIKPIEVWKLVRLVFNVSYGYNDI